MRRRRTWAQRAQRAQRALPSLLSVPAIDSGMHGWVGACSGGALSQPGRVALARRGAPPMAPPLSPTSRGLAGPPPPTMAHPRPPTAIPSKRSKRSRPRPYSLPRARRPSGTASCRALPRSSTSGPDGPLLVRPAATAQGRRPAPRHRASGPQARAQSAGTAKSTRAPSRSARRRNRSVRARVTRRRARSGRSLPRARRGGSCSLTRSRSSESAEARWHGAELIRAWHLGRRRGAGARVHGEK